MSSCWDRDTFRRWVQESIVRDGRNAVYKRSIDRRIAVDFDTLGVKDVVADKVVFTGASTGLDAEPIRHGVGRKDGFRIPITYPYLLKPVKDWRRFMSRST